MQPGALSSAAFAPCMVVTVRGVCYAADTSGNMIVTQCTYYQSSTVSEQGRIWGEFRASGGMGVVFHRSEMDPRKRTRANFLFRDRCLNTHYSSRNEIRVGVDLLHLGMDHSRGLLHVYDY